MGNELIILIPNREYEVEIILKSMDQISNHFFAPEKYFTSTLELIEYSNLHRLGSKINIGPKAPVSEQCQTKIIRRPEVLPQRRRASREPVISIQ